jgi:galactonate dehydratase
MAFMKITTKSGVGEYGKPVAEGKADTVKAAIEDMMAFLIGKDAMQIEDIWQNLYRDGFYRRRPGERHSGNRPSVMGYQRQSTRRSRL